MIRHIVRGCGYLEGFGHHPGTFALFAFVALGAAACARGGLLASLIGAGAMLVVLGPLYLVGAYERSRDSERREARKTAEAASVRVDEIARRKA